MTWDREDRRRNMKRKVERDIWEMSGRERSERESKISRKGGDSYNPQRPVSIPASRMPLRKSQKNPCHMAGMPHRGLFKTSPASFYTSHTPSPLRSHSQRSLLESSS
ncbi:hypothetical protein BDW42DRAFT_165143 [Aspergillus taichungensis]|uniref:Uncharacterized protein n=1 Tax=Aspergillus taichungensis TaxID=482145 RepID=A0A2J5I0P3_9EURO|nr:hypothetical protein BDW42DRAFT_165143 [Aspergillus taichungensis]